MKRNGPTASGRHAWEASWIEPAEGPDARGIQRPAYYLVGEAELAADIASATLFASAHGIYEAFINGVRIGDIELAPGFTAYRKRLQFHAYDVTTLLREGANAVGALLSDGWWRGQHGIVRAVDAYGPTTAFLAELHVKYGSGESAIVGTDKSWRSRPSHVIAADLIAGEVHDLRNRIDAWASAGSDRSDWDSVLVADYGYDELCEAVGPPVRRIQELPSVSITQLKPGRHVVDFGQNLNGWIRLAGLGPEGTEITISYGEWLDLDGDITQENVAAGPFPSQHATEVTFQTDRVISAGDKSVFEPRHSTKGFQYVRVEGYHGILDPSSIQSVVVHTDLTPIGSFDCSDERINKLHRAADRSFRANACEIPTDCPTRERSGWVGDWQLFVATAAELYDVTDWSSKWMRDLAADQLPNGAVTSIVPDPSPGAPVWSASHGSSGWGDAAVHVPWELYRASGRIDALAEHFDAGRRWIDFAATAARTGRHRSRIEARPDPLPHEEFLWDTGWHFGEWLEPGTNMDEVFPNLIKEDHGPVATAYLYRSSDEMAKISDLLGFSDLSAMYKELAANALNAWRAEFIDASGRVQPETQANLVRGLAFGLVPEDLRDQTASRLVELIREVGTHLGTGFLSTPYLLPVLADTGHDDIAFELLLKDDEPSWLNMSERTSTIWEDWDAVRADGRAIHSLNHYGKGAVISFLHQYIGGVRILEPGYRRYLVKPYPGGGIRRAHYLHDSPQGRVEVQWQISDGSASIELDVPTGSEALLELPGSGVESLAPGTHVRHWKA